MEQINEKHYRALELAKIFELLAVEAGCADSKKKINDIKYSTDFDAVKNMLKQTDDAFVILSRFGSPSLRSLKNVEEPLKRVEAQGVLSMEEVLQVGKLLRVIREATEFFERVKIESSMDMYFERLYPNTHLENNIFRSIESEDKMNDAASSELADIRRKIMNGQQKIRTILDSMVTSQTFQKYLQDSIVSMRDGRYVVPVKQEHRTQVEGVIHDTSSTGATVFIEPIKVVAANNEITILKRQEQDEIYRILATFSNEIDLMADSLRSNYIDLINMDVIFAKAKLGAKMNATMPILNDIGEINLIKARHPLIDPKLVVPIDIRLGIDFDTLMITGPNTGGKTVALKTLGLLTLMTMCGLMIPVKVDSHISIFDKVLADIGEEQSIEQNLSTFSAHMTHVIEILKIADSRTLVLFDELGAGTDPVEGAALAMAIIEEIRNKGSKTSITTHYAELKIYALNTEGVKNASCEFDVVSLKPTYRLLIGMPGRSNAFAIAQRLGIDLSIIEQAKKVVSGEKAKFEEVVSSLEEQRQKLEKEHNAVLKEKKEIEELKKLALLETTKQIETQKSETLKAREETERIIQKTQRDSNRLLKELDDIKKEQKQKGFSTRLSQAKAGAVNILDNLTEKSRSLLETENETYKLPRELKVGDKVKIPSLNATGIVLKKPDSSGKVQLQAGIIKTEVEISSVRLIENESKTSVNISGGYSKVQKTRNVGTVPPKEIDIRGENLDEALLRVDQFVDDCVLSNINTIMIIHGKGTGVLKSGIRKHLKYHKNIESFRAGSYGEGEDGVTVIELK